MEAKSRVFRFGPYALDAAKRQLLRGAEPVKLYPKEFDTLLALVERKGQVVEKEELLRTVWPGAVVEESNLSTHISRLRTVLGGAGTNRDYIVTIPGRGYEFVADIDDVAASIPSQAPQRRWRRRHVLAVAGAVLVVGAIAFLYARQSHGRSPSFQQLTFRRGTVWSARFAPDGQTVVYGASWDGSPMELFSTRPGSTESTPLGFAGDILSISGSGEMAVSLGRQFTRPWESSGTLARRPLAGGAPRELRQNVKDADWSADGTELAIVHRSGGHDILQFPTDRTLYEVPGFIMQPRVSRDGRMVAFLQRSSGDESVEILGRDGVRTTLVHGMASMTGLAWSPAGDEVLFTTTRRGTTEVHAVSTSGRDRLVMQTAGEWKLNDIARDGRALMTQDFRRGHVLGARAGDTSERDLGWLDVSVAADLSADGQLLLLAEIGAGGGPTRATYIRRMDGSPAVRLGDGEPVALSPDGKWVIAIRGAAPERLVLLPTGAGESRELEPGAIVDYYRVKWLPDSRHIVFGAIEPGQLRKAYMQDTQGGAPALIEFHGGPGGAVFFNDGRRYVSRDPRGQFGIFPLAGQGSTPLSGVSASEFVIQVGADGHSLFVLRAEGTTLAVERHDLLTGHRTPWKVISIKDGAGVMHAGPEFAPFLVTPDGQAYVYNYLQVLSNLYLVDGLR